MTAERWRRVEELYHVALTRDEEARAAFLSEACAGDDVVSQGTDMPSIWIVEPDAPNRVRKLIEFPGGPRIRGIAWDRSGDAIIIGKHDIASSDIVLLDSAR